jgi:hypothetical protein
MWALVTLTSGCSGQLVNQNNQTETERQTLPHLLMWWILNVCDGVLKGPNSLNTITRSVRPGRAQCVNERRETFVEFTQVLARAEHWEARGRWRWTHVATTASATFTPASTALVATNRFGSLEHLRQVAGQLFALRRFKLARYARVRFRAESVSVEMNGV